MTYKLSPKIRFMFAFRALRAEYYGKRPFNYTLFCSNKAADVILTLEKQYGKDIVKAAVKSIIDQRGFSFEDKAYPIVFHTYLRSDL